MDNRINMEQLLAWASFLVSSVLILAIANDKIGALSLGGARRTVVLQ
jgi:hypothetical protein